MSPLRRLVSDAALYSISSIVGRMFNYLLIPLYTSVFLPAEYGIITECYAYIAFMRVLYTCGIETAYFRFAQRKATTFDLAVSTLLTSSVIFSGLLIAFATPIKKAMALPGSENCVYYIAATLAVDTVLTIPFAQLRLQNRAFFFAAAKLLQIGLNILLNLIVFWGCNSVCADQHPNSPHTWVTRWYDPTRNVEYVFMTNLISNAAALVLFGKTLLQIKYQLSWKPLRKMLEYASPLLLTSLASIVNEMLPRAILRHWLPPNFYPGQSSAETLGIFGACCKPAAIMPLMIQAFHYAAEPFFFSRARQRNVPILLSIVMHWFILGACFVLFAVSANLDLVGHLLLRRAIYHTALDIVPYLLLIYLLMGVYQNLSFWFKLTDRTHYGTWLTVVGTSLTIVLNLLLIPRLGYWGSIWAAMASYVVMNGLCYHWGKRHYQVPYRVGRLMVYVLGTLVSVYLVRSFTYSSWSSAVISNLILTGLFGGLLYVLGVSRKAGFS